MKEILSIIASLGGILSVLGVISYFLVSLGASDFNTLNKSIISNEVLRKLTGAIFGIYVIFTIMIIRPSKITGENVMILTDGLMLIFAGGYFISFYMLNKRIEVLNGNECYDFKGSKVWIFGIIVSLILLASFAIVQDTNKIGYISKARKLFKNFSYNDFQNFFIISSQILLNYIFMMLFLGYLHGIYVYYNLKKYVISSKAIENGRIIGYVLGENEDEIKLKCDNSYPIIIKKDDIDGYIAIPRNVEVKEIGKDLKFKIPTKKNNIAIIFFRLLTERRDFIKIIILKFKKICKKPIKWIYSLKIKFINNVKNYKNIPNYKEIDYEGYMVKFNDMSNKSEELNKK